MILTTGGVFGVSSTAEAVSGSCVRKLKKSIESVPGATDNDTKSKQYENFESIANYELGTTGLVSADQHSKVKK
jgi:hypothetical protein